MIIKLDVGKAYDTINWHVDIVVLIKMGFPSKWIAWISSCLKTSSFSLLINGQPTSWFSSTHGVRQGDPISSYLFILLSQILSNLHNRAKYLKLIPGVCNDLNYDFSHLMYANSLILITSAFRKVTRNIKCCLLIYSFISC